jgi:hypothetical protein
MRSISHRTAVAVTALALSMTMAAPGGGAASQPTDTTAREGAASGPVAAAAHHCRKGYKHRRLRNGKKKCVKRR